MHGAHTFGLMVLGSLLGACSGGNENPGSEGGTEEPEGLGFVDDFDLGDAPLRLTSATRTYTFDFGPEIEEAGTADCSWTLTYTNVEEDRTQPWLCPDCDVIFKADAELTSGQECFDIFNTYDVEQQWIGWSADEGFNAPLKHYALFEDGEATDDGAGHVSTLYTYDDPDGESGFTYQIVGEYAYEVDASVDPWGAYEPLPAEADTECGWPRSGAPAYEGNQLMRKGKVLPDAYLLDTCGDALRIHDFAGHYTVIMGKAYDCPPCQDMAEDEPGFIADMQAAGIEVETLTLMSPALSDPLGTTRNLELDNWVSSFDLTSPVVADRGYAYWVMNEANGDRSGFPYWVLVDPEMKVIDFGSGYGGSTWSSMETSILEDR